MTSALFGPHAKALRFFYGLAVFFADTLSLGFQGCHQLGLALF